VVCHRLTTKRFDPCGVGRGLGWRVAVRGFHPRLMILFPFGELWSFYICETVPRIRRRMAVVHPQPSPPWGRGWRATGVLISRGAPGEGVPTRTSSTIKRRGAWCRRGFIGGSPVNAVWLLPIPSVTRSRRSRWIRLSWVVPVVIRWIHGLDPLTRLRAEAQIGGCLRVPLRRAEARLAPAGESAGGEPPSPPRGRGV
jgi:hypothetical protein